MLITHTTEDGVERIYVTRFCSVRCFFEQEGRQGVSFHIEPGLYAYPPEYERIKDAVGTAVLAELAQRLGISADAVLAQSFSTLMSIADPALPDHYRYARRARSKANVAR